MKSQPFSLFALTFFLAAHVFLITYILSGFLATMLPVEAVSFIFLCGSVITIALLALLPGAVAWLGNARVLLWLVVLEAMLYAGILAAQTPALLLPLLALSIASYSLLLFSIDIFIETFGTDESQTGSARTAHLTVANTALIVAPFMAGAVTEALGFRGAYALAALMLVPLFLLVVMRVRRFPNPLGEGNVKRHRHLQAALRDVLVRPALFRISLLHLSLRIFFAWMVVYAPLHLLALGFGWEQIGLMLSLILIPYVLVELPAGLVADKHLGEKELLIAGFLITAAGTLALTFTSVPSFLFFTVALLLTRVGAALVESMSETYFFKHTSGEDGGLIALFRMLRPLAYVAGMSLGALTLLLGGLSMLWVVIAVLMLASALYAGRLEDTR